MKAKPSSSPKSAPVPATPTPPATELLGMEEVIKMLKTTRPTFYRWVRAGRLKGTKVGRQWRFLREDVERFLQGQEPRIGLPADLTPLIETLRSRLAETGGKEQEPLKVENELAQATDLMIRLAAQVRASELHIDPQPGGLAALRFRLDGALQPIAQFDLRLLPAIVQYWKTLAACNVHETARPQEGRVLLKSFSAGEDLDLRVTVLPAVLGEALTARLLDPKAALIRLDQIQYAEPDKQKLQHWLKSPWGLIVITGPAGCGKTSVLYACLNQVAAASPSTKIVTVEDPVEYLLPGTTQVPVRGDANCTFPSTLRAVLRSSPDVLMVGEIRDLETLNLVLQAGLNGHLVLTTLHTSEAATALQRMLDVGANPFMVADSTKLIVAQRLVRLLCPRCSVPRKPAEDFLKLGRLLARAGSVAWDSLPGNFREPVGCKECNSTGYRGRNVIAEALEITPRIYTALTRRATAADLRAIAVSEGMITLAADGLRRAAEGQTSLAEVIRVLSPIYSLEMDRQQS